MLSPREGGCWGAQRPSALRPQALSSSNQEAGQWPGLGGASSMDRRRGRGHLN